MSEQTNSPVLFVRGLRKCYAGREVVSGVDFEIYPSEVVGLLGPNGAGKTTCFRLVLGLERPEAGRIVFNGVDVMDQPAHVRARSGLGYLPQEPSVFQGLRSWQNIVVALEGLQAHRRDSRSELEAHARKLLAELGLEQVADAPASTLSGGERRRLEIARALATRPTTLLLDEPFAAVDPKGVVELRAMIDALRRRGMGVLLTDHRVAEALRVCDRAYVIESGRVLRHGTPEEVVGDEQVRAAYLGSDFQLRSTR